jgi:hypothetical protein
LVERNPLCIVKPIIKPSSFVQFTLGVVPLKVPIGANAVIKGWDEGLRLFGKGGKGRLLVPSMLGYGPQGSAPVIPQFANLVFDVEITDVTVAPPAPKQQDMPTLQGQPQQANPHAKQ